MWWLLNFIGTLFDLLLTTEKSLSDCCYDAYKEAFSPNHPYLVQCAAWAAMKTVGSREWLRNAMGLQSDTEVREFLTDCGSDFKTVY